MWQHCRISVQGSRRDRGDRGDEVDPRSSRRRVGGSTKAKGGIGLSYKCRSNLGEILAIKMLLTFKKKNSCLLKTQPKNAN